MAELQRRSRNQRSKRLSERAFGPLQLELARRLRAPGRPFRRVSPVAARPREGPLTEPIVLKNSWSTVV
jgi:hypothetical protein